MPLANAAGKHIVTIEGINPDDGSLTPVQRALVDESGTQCGFCTVGFVMSLTGYCVSGGGVSSPHVSKGSSVPISNADTTGQRTPDHNTPFLHRMHGLELVEADLKKTGISIGKHPMAFIREELSKRGILSAFEARHLKKNQIVSVAGAVIIRQRPMTAKNVVFMTLEDETGHSNFVVMPDTFEKYRAVINQNDYLIIKGIFEERGMLKAIAFTPINDYFTAEVVSHNFR